MKRRDVLKYAASLTGRGTLIKAVQPLLGLAAIAAEVLPAHGQAAHTGIRQAPAKSLTLQAGELSVVFDAHDGLPYAYTFNGQRLWGEDEGQPVLATICRFAPPRQYPTVQVYATGMKQTSQDLSFEFLVDADGVTAATFRLRYTLAASSLVVTMEDVLENAGFELIEVAVPQLIAVREEDGPAWMAEGRKGGSFVWLQAAKSYRFKDNEYFGRISTELPVGMVGRAGIGCVMEVTAYHDGTETEIKGGAGTHHASLGCTLTHRVHGGRCYSMNDGGPPVCGNGQTVNLLIEQIPRTRFDFFPCKDQPQPWLEGARIVLARMPPAPTQYFSDRFLYIVGGKRKIDANPQTTFAQSEKLVRDIAALTDYAPQVVMLSGWAYDGQDTGFPSEDKINASLGTEAELLQLIQTGKRFNANITLNVNYDDAYKSSPIFDEAFIARRPDGEIWKSRAWDGEDSYVTGMAKYMNGGWGSKRIAFTADHFKVKDAMLIDAMSWFAVRNDWDPQHPASGYKNLVEGKFRILEEFKQRGIAVTSEQLRYPFVGRLAVSMDGPGISNCPFGGEAVPLLSTIYRGSTIWGTGEGTIHPQQELFWNTRSSLWFYNDSPRTRATDFYYLVALPYSKLHSLRVENYESRNASRRLVLEQDSHVAMETGTQAYSATWQGIEIAKDDATFCPIDDHRVAFYALTARQLRYPVPKSWEPAKITARTLTVDGPSAHVVQMKNGMIVVDVAAKTPVIVYASSQAIPHAT